MQPRRPSQGLQACARQCVDQLMRGIAARAGDIYRVPHFVRGLNPVTPANGFLIPLASHPGRLLQSAFVALSACTLVSTGFCGDGFYLHQQIVFTGLRHRQVVISTKVEGFSGLTAMAFTDMVCSSMACVLLS